MDTTPSSQWFYSKNGEQKGPVPFSELQDLLSSGLPATSLVWTEGAAEWVPASSIPELIQQTAADPENPYAAPSTNAELTSDPGNYGTEDIPEPPIPLDIGFCLTQGWKHTFANFGLIVLLGLVYIGITFGMGLIFGLGQIPFGDTVSIDPETGATGPPNTGSIVYQVITTIIQQLVSIFLSLGVVRFGLNLLKGESPEIGTLFSQSDKFLTALAATILFGLMAIAGFILFILPGIFIIIRFGYYMQAIVEKNLNPIDALKYSWNLTRSNFWAVFGLGFVNFLIILVGCLPCFLGLIIAVPFTWLASLVSYRYLHAGPQGIKVLS